jgi:hypothetical protein
MQAGLALGVEILSVPALSFSRTYHEVAVPFQGNFLWIGEFKLLIFMIYMYLDEPPGDAIKQLPEMPNPLRKLADDKELYVVMLPLWCDNVSGNWSKQYNKHIT